MSAKFVWSLHEEKSGIVCRRGIANRTNKSITNLLGNLFDSGERIKIIVEHHGFSAKMFVKDSKIFSVQTAVLKNVFCSNLIQY